MSKARSTVSKLDYIKNSDTTKETQYRAAINLSFPVFLRYGLAILCPEFLGESRKT
jgi:hypothetical protein